MPKWKDSFQTWVRMSEKFCQIFSTTYLSIFDRVELSCLRPQGSELCSYNTFLFLPLFGNVVVPKGEFCALAAIQSSRVFTKILPDLNCYLNRQDICTTYILKNLCLQLNDWQVNLTNWLNKYLVILQHLTHMNCYKSFALLWPLWPYF